MSEQEIIINGILGGIERAKRHLAYWINQSGDEARLEQQYWMDKIDALKTELAHEEHIQTARMMLNVRRGNGGRTDRWQAILKREHIVEELDNG